MIRAVGHAMTELPPENLDDIAGKFDPSSADLDDVDDETALAKVSLF